MELWELLTFEVNLKLIYISQHKNVQNTVSFRGWSQFLTFSQVYVGREWVKDWYILFEIKKMLKFVFAMCCITDMLLFLFSPTWHILLHHLMYGTLGAGWVSSSSAVSPSEQSSLLHSNTLKTNHACAHPSLIPLSLTYTLHRAPDLPGTFVSNFVLNINVFGTLPYLFR